MPMPTANGPKPKRLYDHQEQQVAFLLDSQTRAIRAALCVGPTSSGKTAVMRVALKLRKPRAALVLVPQINLEAQLALTEVYEHSDGSVTTFRREDWAILREMDTTWDWAGFGLCTHAKARMLFRDPTIDLTDVVIVIDEGHHSGQGTDLHEFLAWAYDRGAEVWVFTGTPVRRDRRPLFPKHVEPRVTILPQVVLMRKGWPKRIQFETIRLGASSAIRAAGRLLDEDYKEIAKVLRETERHALVSVTAGSSLHLAVELRAQLIAAGIPEKSIAITTGDDTVLYEGEEMQRAQYVNRIMEQNRALVESGQWSNVHRILIDCRRCTEGLDAPTLSLLLQYGVPSSLIELVQKIGRILRNKTGIKGFPQEWAEAVRVVLAIPNVEDDAAARARAIQQLVLLASYFAAPDVAYDYLGFWEDLATRLPPHAAQAARERRATLPEDDALLRKRMLELGVPSLGKRGVTVNKFIGHVAAAAAVDGKFDVAAAVAIVEQFLQFGADVEPAIFDWLKAVAAETYNLPVASGTPAEREAAKQTYTNALWAGFQRIAAEFPDLVVPLSDRVLAPLVGALGPAEIEAISARMAQERDAVYDLPIAKVAEIIDGYRAANDRHITTYAGVEVDLSAFVGFVFHKTDLDRCIRRQWPGLNLNKMIVLAQHGALKQIGHAVRPGLIQRSVAAALSGSPEQLHADLMRHPRLVLAICVEFGWSTLAPPELATPFTAEPPLQTGWSSSGAFSI